MLQTERKSLPTPKHSDMERQLRLLLTREENNLLTIELAKSPPCRDCHIAMLIAGALRATAR